MRRVGWLLLALLSGPAFGHGLKVFAVVEGEWVSGYAYFAGGRRAADVAVLLERADGAVSARTRSDGNGEFTLPAHHEAVRVVADGGDGHRGTFPLAAPLPEPMAAAAPGGTPDIAELERVIAHQLRPLREELAAYEERRRWNDVLGGIGYIVGLAGVALWFGSRRR